jgi:competence protein ComEA
MLATLRKVIAFVALLFISSAACTSPININTADAEVLAQNIIGVGQRKAEAIVAYRKKNGPFKNAQELTNIKGIGQRLIDKNKEVLRVADTADKGH